jgi:hypothetical protein
LYDYLPLYDSVLNVEVTSKKMKGHTNVPQLQLISNIQFPLNKRFFNSLSLFPRKFPFMFAFFTVLSLTAYPLHEKSENRAEPNSNLDLSYGAKKKKENGKMN